MTKHKKITPRKKIEYFAFGANGTTDPRFRDGSNKICSECGEKFSYWDDLNIHLRDETVKCASCKNIMIVIVRK